MNRLTWSFLALPLHYLIQFDILVIFIDILTHWKINPTLISKFHIQKKIRALCCPCKKPGSCYSKDNPSTSTVSTQIRNQHRTEEIKSFLAESFVHWWDETRLNSWSLSGWKSTGTAHALSYLNASMNNDGLRPQMHTTFRLDAGHWYYFSPAELVWSGSHLWSSTQWALTQISIVSIMFDWRKWCAILNKMPEGSKTNSWKKIEPSSMSDYDSVNSDTISPPALQVRSVTKPLPWLSPGERHISVCAC